MKMLDRKSGGVFKLWKIPRTPWIQDCHANPKRQKIEGTNIETLTEIYNKPSYELMQET